MQSLGVVTIEQLKSSVQSPKAKFEIYYGGAWVDLTNLAGKNYLKSFSMSLGGASPTSDPVAGTWSAVIDNPDGIFYPANTTSAYKDYFTSGRKVRISVGGTYGGTDAYWPRIIGVMDSPRFKASVDAEVQLKGMDFSQYLKDFKLKSPENYWGDVTTISTKDPVESLGAEIYAEHDALEIGGAEGNSVAPWGAPAEITITSEADATGGSTYVMKAVIVPSAALTTENFTTPGAQQWLCPAGVTEIIVEVWGGGGGGGGSSTPYNGGGGGGGGAYSKKVAIPVTPGNLYSFNIGAGGGGGSGAGSGGDGGDTYFIDVATVLAKGGAGGTAGTSEESPGVGGHAGLASEGIGDVKHYGGGGADS